MSFITIQDLDMAIQSAQNAEEQWLKRNHTEWAVLSLIRMASLLGHVSISLLEEILTM